MSILSAEQIRLNVKVNDKYEAIRLAGQMLVDAGHVDQEYIDKMIERENALSTYMGSGLAIPHGTNEAKGMIKSTGLAVLQIPGGVDFGGDEPAVLVVGIAARNGEHMEILTSVAMVCSDEDSMESIRTAKSAEEILNIFESGMEE
ncbi:PTS sugar transporter subunit IIA [Paenibacillus chibensis]|uniref:Mannitol-specific phosphotransferase enzyme IIA component n=1 Tax=Paenibacillus chibensis TaxID=59846 RepID=A0ABU6PQY6_9BACL|nr:PTS sugar transporter subunit IIA [Paenibacillus chibensis]